MVYKRGYENDEKKNMKVVYCCVCVDWSGAECVVLRVATCVLRVALLQ